MNQTKLSIPALRLPGAYVIGPKSFQSDCAVAACDIIAMPERDFAGADFHISAAPGRSLSQRIGSKRKLLQKITGPGKVHDVAGHVLDFRVFSPDNWAHFLCYHIPVFFALARLFQLSPSQITVLLPAKTPGFILQAAALFEMTTLCTDHPVEGEIMSLDPATWSGMRGARRMWVAQAGLPEFVAEKGQDIPGYWDEKYFLSRRTTRALENADAVEAVLHPLGYQTVYMEDLSALEQILLLQRAESVVAIHGAALAPMLYSLSSSRLTRLIEIQPVGHAETFFQEIAQMCGIHWTGLRGCLKPDYVPEIYRTDSAGYFKHSLDSFTADIPALTLALSFSDARKTPPADLL